MANKNHVRASNYNAGKQGEARKAHLHLLQLGKALKNSRSLQTGQVIVIKATGEKTNRTNQTISPYKNIDVEYAHFVFPHSSVVDEGMCSGILVSFRLEQSTTFASQRHLGGHTGSLLQALFRRMSSVPAQEKNQAHTIFF